MIVQCWDRWTANELNRARSDLLWWHLRLEKLSALGVLGTLRQNLNHSQSFHFIFPNKNMFISLLEMLYLTPIFWTNWVRDSLIASKWTLNLISVKDDYLYGRKLATNGQKMAILAGGVVGVVTKRWWICSSSLKYFKNQNYKKLLFKNGIWSQ